MLPRFVLYIASLVGLCTSLLLGTWSQAAGLYLATGLFWALHQRTKPAMYLPYAWSGGNFPWLLAVLLWWLNAIPTGLEYLRRLRGPARFFAGPAGSSREFSTLPEALDYARQTAQRTGDYAYVQDTARFGPPDGLSRGKLRNRAFTVMPAGEVRRGMIFPTELRHE